MRPKLQVNHQQKLILTQGMKQSLQILQLSQLELGELIAEEIEKNPLLELESEGFSRSRSGQKEDLIFPDIAERPSLHEHLLRQIWQVFDDTAQRQIAEELTGLLNEKGFLDEPLTPEQESILPFLQTFDPPGIFAKSCQEGFILQLERLKLKDSDSYQLVTKHYDDLLQKRFKKIEKTFPCTSKQLFAAIHTLSKLATRPAATFEPIHNKHVFADLHVVKINDQWELTPIEDALPRFRVNTEYSQLSGQGKEQKELLNGFRSAAKWLQQSIERRRELILKVGSHLVKHQTAYLSNEGPLAPISPEELATLFGVHESTISRALTDKYIESPLGTIRLNSLISTRGTDPAKQLLQRLIFHENKQAPLTDDQLAAQLRESGHQIARRTVAKYRMQCKIGPVNTRKLVS